MNIANQFQQIGILITHDCLVAPLKKVSYLPISPVKILAISKQKRLHNSAQRGFFNLQKKVDVVFHQCIGIETEMKFSFGMRKVDKEFFEILFMPEYALPPISPADDMVECTGKMYPRTTSHTGNVSKDDPYVNYRINEA
jgi:hypothetical protein